MAILADVNASTSTSRLRELGSEHRLGGLLALILVSLIFQLSVPDTAGSRLVVVLLQGATLLVALVASGARRVVVRVAAVVVAISMATAVAALFGDSDLSPTSSRLVTLLLVGLAPVAIAIGIVRDVKAQRAVTLRTMFGVLCIYLLIGMFFSFCFHVIQQLSDEPFFAKNVSGNVSEFLYYSFTALTTTGFGDFTAGNNLGRSLSITEALIGQIYLVTVVALIVGNLRPRRRDGVTDAPGDERMAAR